MFLLEKVLDGRTEGKKDKEIWRKARKDDGKILM